MPIKTKSEVPVLAPTEARDGLYELLRSKSRTAEYWRQRDMHECVLDEHPFGLDTAILPPHPLADTRSRLIAWPGYTDDSVEAMKMMLAHHASEDDFRLRIIHIEKPERLRDDATQHLQDLYFELITGIGSFICGGCNNYSGEGGAGGRQLTTIFRFLAAHAGVKLEEVTIPESEVGAQIQKLKDDYDARTRTRVA